MAKPKREIDWNEHYLLKELDEEISQNFSREEEARLMDKGYVHSCCISDVKYQMKRAIEERIDAYNNLLELVEELPDDEDPTYYVDDDEEPTSK